jgi:hypothetical protein
VHGQVTLLVAVALKSTSGHAARRYLIIFLHLHMRRLLVLVEAAYSLDYYNLAWLFILFFPLL